MGRAAWRARQIVCPIHVGDLAFAREPALLLAEPCRSRPFPNSSGSNARISPFGNLTAIVGPIPITRTGSGNEWWRTESPSRNWYCMGADPGLAAVMELRQRWHMGPNRRAQERERAATRAVEEAKRAEAERKAAAEAQKIVEIWNARQAGGKALWFYPTIGAAIAAGFPWLTFYCPACTVAGFLFNAAHLMKEIKHDPAIRHVPGLRENALKLTLSSFPLGAFQSSRPPCRHQLVDRPSEVVGCGSLHAIHLRPHRSPSPLTTHAPRSVNS